MVTSSYEAGGDKIIVAVTNKGATGGDAIVTDAYTGRSVVEFLAAGKSFVKHFELDNTYGWYNLAVTTDADPSLRRFSPVTSRPVATVQRPGDRRRAARTSRLIARFSASAATA